MILTLALRNLLHDRVRFAATVIGIVFSVILVAVQLGLYISFSRQVSTIIRHSAADLWVVPKGTKSFEDLSLLDAADQYRALTVDGIADLVPVAAGFGEWHKPNGETTTVVIIGSDPSRGALMPWNVVEGAVNDLSRRQGVVVDRSYAHDLGIDRLGDTASIEDRPVKVVAMTEGIRAFTTASYVFTLPERARALLGLNSGDVSHLLVRLMPGVDPSRVQAELSARLTKSEVLTRDQFAERSQHHWLFSTGAGFALIAGAMLGIVVGTVIVAQTLYASAKDHLPEFATLRAIGSTSIYIHKVILTQAMISALIGFSLAAFASLGIVWITTGAVLPVIITPPLLALLLAVTLLMCAVSAVVAIAKVTRIDPATVFAR
jgi:putative ABC transport system permease protein